MGPLQGLRVVELGGIGPVPFCGMILADLGAEVVRVHRPGDGPGKVNPVLDRGKRSVEVDLRDAGQVLRFRRYLVTADIVVEGFRPGVAERLGLSPESLLAEHPALVYGRMTGFGQSGPLAQRAGHDINYIALSGALDAIGHAGERPTPPLNLVGDFGGGGLMLALGVLAATLHARETGQGQVVDAAMVDGSAVLMAMIHGFRNRGTWSLDRGTNLLDTGAPFYDTYECSDGRYVAVGAIEPQFFVCLVENLGLDQEIDTARQNDRAYWPRLRSALTRAFGSAPRDHWATVFAPVDACVTPVLDMAEAPAHEHNQARGVFLEDRDGALSPAPAPRFTATPNSTPGPAPFPGQDNNILTAHESGTDS
jgi:alpha-methylacyl-CoA racemase